MQLFHFPIFEANRKIVIPKAVRVTTFGILTGFILNSSLNCKRLPCVSSIFLDDHSNILKADVEFSVAISLSLEYAHVEVLKNSTIGGGFALVMKNEILESLKVR